MKNLLKFLPIVLALGFAIPANAAVITITNASFEDGSTLGNGFSSSNINGWNTTGGSSTGRFNPNSQLSPEAFDEVYAAYSNGGSISQLLGVNLLADTTYTLSVAVGNRTFHPFPGFSVLLLAGGSELTGGTVDYTAPQDGSWQTYTYTYNSIAAGGELAIRLTSSGIQTNFDAVNLTAVAAVPEPTTYAMFLAGLGLLSFTARRKA